MCFTKINMIDNKQILANAPSNMGEQIHVNHKGCEAGVDTKKRLYIKRNDKGLLAYCHHCNQSGFVNDSSRLSSWVSTKELASAYKHNTKPVLSTLTTEGKVWLHSNYCDTNDTLFAGIAGERHKVALTLLNPEQEVIGWQVRNLLSTPKYLTHYVSTSSKGDASWFHKNSKTLVITEDYLSAYRVHKNTGFSSVALLRTMIADKALSQMYELNFEFVSIWLDPDEAGQKGASKAYKKLNHFLPTTTKLAIFGINKEPKECTPEELKSILV